MRRTLAMAAVVTVTGLVGVAAPAQAANDTSRYPLWKHYLQAKRERRDSRWWSEGGYPRTDANCDHFFQFIGVIGSGK